MRSDASPLPTAPKTNVESSRPSDWSGDGSTTLTLSAPVTRGTVGSPTRSASGAGVGVGDGVVTGGAVRRAQASAARRRAHAAPRARPDVMRGNLTVGPRRRESRAIDPPWGPV